MERKIGNKREPTASAGSRSDLLALERHRGFKAVLISLASEKAQIPGQSSTSCLAKSWPEWTAIDDY